MASKLSPVGAEVDDQSMTLLRFADGKIGYVGSCWTSPGIFAMRVFGSKGLMHYEIDFGTWDTPDLLHETSTLYIQRGKDGYAKREEMTLPESDMFRDELEMFAESCRTGKANELTAHNGNVAVAVVYAALSSIERKGESVRIAEVMADSHRKLGEPRPPCCLRRYFIDLTQPEIAAQLRRIPLVILPAAASSSTARTCRPAPTSRRQRDRARGRRAHGRRWCCRRRRSASRRCTCRSKARSR